MFNIAVCDDDQVLCENMEKIIKDADSQFFEPVAVEVFYSGDSLCRSMDKKTMT